MIGVELSKLLRRPRTWVTITLLAGLPVVVGIFLKATGIAPRPGSGPALLSEVLNNGVLFPAAALALILPVFLPVAVAVIVGDAIAGEASAGTLRYLLARPVSRSRLVTAKVVMALVFIVLAIAIVAIVGLIAGAALFGIKPLTSLSGTGLTTQQAIQRTVLAVLYIGWSMLGLAGIALFASTRTDSPLAAALSVAGRLRDVAGPGPDRRHPVHQALPADPLLAVVRRPLPRPDPLARHPARRRAPSRLPDRLPRRGLGQLHDEGHHKLSPSRAGAGASSPGASGSAGAPQRGLTHCRAKRVGASRSEAAAGDEESVAEVGELQGDGEIGVLQQLDDRLQVVALLARHPDLDHPLGLVGPSP